MYEDIFSPSTFIVGRAIAEFRARHPALFKRAYNDFIDFVLGYRSVYREFNIDDIDLSKTHTIRKLNTILVLHEMLNRCGDEFQLYCSKFGRAADALTARSEIFDLFSVLFRKRVYHTLYLQNEEELLTSIRNEHRRVWDRFHNLYEKHSDNEKKIIKYSTLLFYCLDYIDLVSCFAHSIGLNSFTKICEASCSKIRAEAYKFTPFARKSMYRILSVIGVLEGESERYYRSTLKYRYLLLC